MHTRELSLIGIVFSLLELSYHDLTSFVPLATINVSEHFVGAGIKVKVCQLLVTDEFIHLTGCRDNIQGQIQSITGSTAFGLQALHSHLHSLRPLLASLSGTEFSSKLRTPSI